MPPASVAHFKHRAPASGTGTSANGNAVDQSQLPPMKRARESPTKPVPESARAAKERTPPLDGKSLKLTVGTSPPSEEKKTVRGKMACAVDAVVESGPRSEPFKGKYDLSDPETLDCSVCCNPLFLPVYQCKNGHTACPTCWSTLERAKKQCHSCEEKWWNIRCLTVEKILEHLSVRCQHSVYGCGEFLKFLHKKEHEEIVCRYRPFKCPLENCRYDGPKPALLQHFDKVHQMQAVQINKVTKKVNFTMLCTEKYKLLQSDQELYVVFHESMAEYPGDIFYCASFGPYRRSYMLTVEVRTESRYHVIQATVPEMKTLQNWKLKRNYLIVPTPVQEDPRSPNCLFDLHLELFGPVFQVPVRTTPH